MAVFSLSVAGSQLAMMGSDYESSNSEQSSRLSRLGTAFEKIKNTLESETLDSNFETEKAYFKENVYNYLTELLKDVDEEYIVDAIDDELRNLENEEENLDGLNLTTNLVKQEMLKNIKSFITAESMANGLGAITRQGYSTFYREDIQDAEKML